MHEQNDEDRVTADREGVAGAEGPTLTGEASALSRRSFLRGTLVAATAVAAGQLGQAQEPAAPSAGQNPNPQRPDGLFEWQFPSADKEKEWKRYSFNKDRWWGDFSHDLPDQADMFADNPWALGPFTKYRGNPVLAPTPGAWDQGRYGGGVHNGAVIIKDGKFYYVYRGERPIDVERPGGIDYICDIGVAVSNDGIHFTKDTAHNPFFRKGEDRKYSYEDVNIARWGDTYYMFCNQWLWGEQGDPRVNGTFLATSKDLLNWEKVGIVFPKAKRIHRNAVVLQNPKNEAVKVGGKFVMYINDQLIAYSTDMVHWESRDNPNRWPGGEGCFALTNHDPKRPDDIILFTGGAHTGHFYAVGEVLLSKADPEKPLRWLPRSPLFAEPKYRYENGFTAEAPHKPISSFADCIFFNGLTRHRGRWWLYYGGSEYYTCLANSTAAPGTAGGRTGNPRRRKG
jgi:predicted GH43/DUF377 family glycosyl hydrolase